MRTVCRHLTVLFLAIGLHSASAFSLLGPFEPWMTTNLGFINNINGGVDIGGPKDLGEGYRWNVPVITYGFDQSFLDYFGSNGVAAVESAIQIFNDLPSASETNLNGYLLATTRENFQAAQLGLSDLKSSALGLVLEQLGLASPSRYVFTLRDFTGQFDSTVIMRSFDPVAFGPSPYVNGTFFTDYVESFGQVAFCDNFSVDLEEPSVAAVADYTFNDNMAGVFHEELTRDDVGGLYYLYGTNNFALECLIPGVRGAGTNASNYVSTAIRPGVGKITFQRLTNDLCHGGFVPITICYQDSYLTNNALEHQMLEREVKQPDILFTAAHLGFYQYSRTGTTNWVNNGEPSQNGPGVIQPPVSINFARLGPIISPLDAMYSGPADFYAAPSSWATFDGTTNAPILYPVDSIKNNSTVVNLQLGIVHVGKVLATSWALTGQHDKVFLLQTSTNMADWVTITSVTNTGQDLVYSDFVSPTTPQRFFRTIPQ
jgi:hypothetical protein